MSRERCIATKGLVKQALSILQSNSAGAGRGISLAITHLEDAFMRIDFHMRENGWLNAEAPKPPNLPPGSIMPNSPPTTRPSTLVPAPPIPQLNTGLMNKPPEPKRSKEDLMDDISLL